MAGQDLRLSLAVEICLRECVVLATEMGCLPGHGVEEGPCPLGVGVEGEGGAVGESQACVAGWFLAQMASILWNSLPACGVGDLCHRDEARRRA